MIILYVALFVFILPPSNREKDKHHDQFIFIDHHTYEQCHIITSYLNVFIKRKDPNKIPTNKGLCLSLLLINVSTDVNPNPGQPSSSIDATIYPCGTCDQPVTWENRGIVCDTCNQWYHVSCQSMSSNTYLEHANDSAVAWDCVMCNCPNFSTFCYSKAFSTSNQYSILSDISLEKPRSV
jgi:hypothetical protein